MKRVLAAVVIAAILVVSIFAIVFLTGNQSVVGLGAVAVVAAIAGAAVSAGCTGGDAGAWSAVDRVSPRWLENAPRSSPSANVAIAIGRPRVDCAGAGGRTVTATGLMETGATRGAAAQSSFL